MRRLAVAALIALLAAAGAARAADAPAAGADAATAAPAGASGAATDAARPQDAPAVAGDPDGGDDDDDDDEEVVELSPDERDAARIAWTYFERNTHPNGLVSSVDGYPSTTLWDLGSTVLATVAARELGLLDDAGFDGRISRLLATVAALPLFEGELPNKAYDARTGAMTDYQNRPSPRGIGFSALDVARFVSALEILAERHPAHAAAAARAVERWRWCRMLGGGELHGALRGAGGEVRGVQEGRLGYEQYAARALAPLGVDVSRALRTDRDVVEEDILGVKVRRDARDRKRFGAVDALVTEPFALDALEHGESAELSPLLATVLEVQRRRWRETGSPTAMSEDHVDRAPWFVYGGIWAGGGAWRTVGPDGEDASALRGLSTKAAFSLAALHPDDPYARVLLDAVAGARDPQRGWFAGVYERGGPNRSLNANTNGVVLEALLYRAVGPLREAADGASDSPLARVARRAAASCPPALERVALEVSPGAGGGIGAPPAALPPPSSAPRPFRVDGAVYGGWRGMDRGLGGAVATVWPWRFGFVRLGAEATTASPGGSARLLWGVGWDDWHERTFFLHVDNWGPVRPNDALATRQAEVNAGYRLPQLCAARWLCAAPVAAVTAPFAGGPYASARVNVTIAGEWFLMGGIGRTLPGVWQGPAGTPDWRVFYGLGRWSWKPGSVFLTYYDWGPDSRQGNGILALGVNWAF